MSNACYITDEIIHVSKGLSIPVTIIEQTEAITIRKKINFLYLGKGNGELNYESYCDDKAWMLIKDFLTSSPIMFFNIDSDQQMLRFDNGEDMHSVINGSFGFPFYVTDDTLSFLIYLDDHDCLACFGNSLSWCKKIREESKRR